jgi:hypothetical protein
VYLDELFETAAWSRKPIVETFVIWKKAENLMILPLQKFVDYARVKRTTEVSVQICIKRHDWLPFLDSLVFYHGGKNRSALLIYSIYPDKESATGSDDIGCGGGAKRQLRPHPQALNLQVQ